MPRPNHEDIVWIGVLAGEGIGPEVIEGLPETLRSVAEATGLSAEIREGGVIGRDAERNSGTALSMEVIEFCDGIFARGGAILSGPGGGRYVYDLRRHFDLFLKISPLRIASGLPDVSRLRPEALFGLDVLIVRENTGGAYQGTWNEQRTVSGDRLAEHHVEYSEFPRRRFLQAAARLARSRRGELTVVWKESGLPAISGLWWDCARETADALGVRLKMVDIDLMAYRLIQDAPTFDVIARPICLETCSPTWDRCSSVLVVCRSQATSQVMENLSSRPIMEPHRSGGHGSREPRRSDLLLAKAARVSA